MTDLIARLEWFEEGMAECAAEGHDNPNVPWCDYCTNLRDKRDTLLVDNLPAIIHALKVLEAAEGWRKSHRYLGWGASREAEEALVRAVKGEQP